MAEIKSGRTFSTYLDGSPVELPATINGVRAALPPDLRITFDTELGDAAAEDLFVLMAEWAQKTRPDLLAAKEAIFKRLARGDHSGLISAEEVSEYFGPGGVGTE
ncbi:hypothetical protein [Streptomyces sp. NBC_00690]|uniref:hypothetical protein n=1 Tax=Streptomyces sp. NBC_00690 TaxID=2975808 RepID=UPI002E27E35D|nr:hypothetical protein [Streptomyces sp. NBC_00690]